jgi:hypothetical protein
LTESYAGYEKRELDESESRALALYRMDQQALLRFALEYLVGGGLSRSPSEAGDLLERATVARYSRAENGLDPTECATCMKGALGLIAGIGRDCRWQDLGAIAGSIAGIDATPLVPKGSAGDFGRDRAELARAILRQVIDVETAPRFFDYDYIDDVIGLVGGRYCGDNGPRPNLSGTIVDALRVLAGPNDPPSQADLPAALRKLVGTKHEFVPKRGDVTRYVWDVIPELAEEFVGLKAENNVARFLEINRQYSLRQATRQGAWDNRDLALLRGYERNHHLLLRTLIGLIQSGEVTSADDVLLIGPRHVDEVEFFRRHLNLPKTVGLDLFEFGNGRILAGDMHDMPFESNRFKLAFCAGTLSYSYNVRRVIREVARTTTRPGYVFLIDAAGRKAGPDALGRSDVMNVDALIGMFHEHAYSVLAKDAGRSLAPHQYDNEPCLVVRLDGANQESPGTRRDNLRDDRPAEHIGA